MAILGIKPTWMDLTPGVAHDTSERYKGYLKTELKAIFDKYRNQAHYKYPFSAIVKDEQEKDMLVAAITLYHSVFPQVQKIRVYDKGAPKLGQPEKYGYEVHAQGYNYVG